jgi:hypothetical protein
MASGSIDLDQFVAELLSTDEVLRAARQEAANVLEQQKEILLREFDNHPVTKEIEAGPEAANLSGTLGGKGNLFSFIGFDDADTPVAPVKELLNGISLGSMRRNNAMGVLNFKVNMPSEEEFEAISKMPWETGRSWLFEIERAISGLGNYIYGQFKNSRSGTGYEVSSPVDTKTFSPVPYFRTMLEKFVIKLKQ